MTTGFLDLGFAKVDVGRLERRGLPEVAWAEGKSPDDLTRILETLVEKNGIGLATRAGPQHFEKVVQTLPDARFESVGRCIVVERKPLPHLAGKVAVVSAGTTDRPVVEEARVTLEHFGNSVEIVQDVGVAGVQRALAAREQIESCSVAIVVAGMDGALPSVIAGLVSTPVIAVPTSVGYGASFGGIAALLTMLNSCASGVTVVNIDNGFGAAYAASLINQKITAAILANQGRQSLHGSPADQPSRDHKTPAG
jgi:NCAIR mutase (PurE)-related protein